MSFAVSADAYDRFMGRYSKVLAPVFADFAGIAAGQRVLDVGCGPGALTSELVARVGASAVCAVDPSESFVETAIERHPGVDVRSASAANLPFADGEFDAALAQLVVHFMADPVAGLTEMRRVTRLGGVVAACVWDHGDRGPLSDFWNVSRALDPHVEDESELPGVREGHLAELLAEARLDAIEATGIEVSVDYLSFEDWWQPYTLGVGPSGAFVARLGDDRRAELRERCRAALPAGAFTMTGRAWAARGRVLDGAENPFA